jgi:hypothetical protein
VGGQALEQRFKLDPGQGLGMYSVATVRLALGSIPSTQEGKECKDLSPLSGRWNPVHPEGCVVSAPEEAQWQSPRTDWTRRRGGHEPGFLPELSRGRSGNPNPPARSLLSGAPDPQGKPTYTQVRGQARRLEPVLAGHRALRAQPAQRTAPAEGQKQSGSARARDPHAPQPDRPANIPK